MLLLFPFLLTTLEGVLWPTAGLPVALLFRNVTLARLARHCCIQIRRGVREHCVTARQEVGILQTE